MSTSVSKKSKSSDKAKLAIPVIQEIDLDKIEVRLGRRALDLNWVEALAQDIKAIGQRTPIEVLSTETGYRLIAGNHRMAACHLNGASTIQAIVKQPTEFASEVDIRLHEIAENFMRRELNVLDRAMDVAAWREIYELAQGAIKPGRKSKKAIRCKLAPNSPDVDFEAASFRFASSFGEASQEALGLSSDAIKRSLKISTITQGAREAIALHPICDNQSELLNLAKEPSFWQRPIADMIVSGVATNVAAAVALIENTPQPKPLAPLAKISEGFSRLKPKQQKEFFELHVDAIELWLAGRGK